MKMMNTYLELWKTTSLWDRANWFCEGGEDNFNVLVAKYEIGVEKMRDDRRPVVLVGYCRGKISEGIDFPDHKA